MVRPKTHPTVAQSGSPWELGVGIWELTAT
jgi:hypothetical protein